MLTNIFKKAEVLNKDLHKDLKLSQYKNYEFAKDAYIVPLSLEEMVAASKSLIIVFIKDSQNNIYPSAILGGENSKNMLLDDEYKWRPNVYIPASIRCYPFGITENENQKYIIVDTEADVLKDDNGNLIIQDKENLTQHGEYAIKFTTEIYNKIDAAKELGSHLDKLGVLKQAEINIEKDGEKNEIKQGVYIVDEKALTRLESRKLKKLATSGFTPLVYAHLFSLSNRY